jgi:hypothetical protein
MTDTNPRPGHHELTDLHAYVVPDSPKMLRETLCVAQAGINELIRGGTKSAGGSMESHRDRLQRLIDECERMRPTGPDGKHGDRHTAECGCINKAAVQRAVGR